MNLFPWVIKKIQGNYLKEIVIFVHKLAKNKWLSTKGNFNKFSNTLEPIMRQCMNLDEP